MRRLLLSALAALCFAAPALAQTEGAALNPGTLANRSGLIGCVYRSSPPAPVNGQQMAVGCDSSGQLAISGTINASTAATATAAAPSYVEGTPSPLSQDLSGALRVTGSFSATTPYAAATGGAVPAQASYGGLNNSGSLIGAAGDSSGRQIVAGAGTAGASVGGVLSVQGVASGTALPVSGTFWQATQPISGAVTVASTTITASVPGVGPTNEAKAEDGVAATGDTGVAVWAVRRDTPVTSVSAAGDYSELAVNNVGRLWTSTTIDAALPTGANVIGALTANQSVNNAQINGVTVTTGNGVAGTGVQRVAIASDNTPFASINAPSGAVSANGITPVATATANACQVLKASAGNFYGASGYVSAASFIMVFNAASAPADGVVTPVAVAYASAAGSWSIDYGLIPTWLGTGVTVCASSTGPFTKTAFATSNFITGRVQ